MANTTKITLSIPSEVDDDLEAIAALTGRTKSQIVAAGIEHQRDALVANPKTKALFASAREIVGCRG